MIRRGRSEKLISHACSVFQKLPVRFPEFVICDLHFRKQFVAWNLLARIRHKKQVTPGEARP